MIYSIEALVTPFVFMRTLETFISGERGIFFLIFMGADYSKCL